MSEMKVPSSICGQMEKHSKVYHGDSQEILKTVPENTVDVCLCDPPYFLDKLDNAWNSEAVASTRNMQVVTSLPSGMKFDREQGYKFYSWYLPICQEIHRVLKPGAFFFSFSSPRLYHRMVCAAEDAGFLIKDALLWLYTTNQPKAMSLNHFIDKLPYPDAEKNKIKADLAGWKTPQMKSCYEPIMMGQKPPAGTFLANQLEHQVGLINTNLRIGDDKFVANVLSMGEIDETIDRFFLIDKPAREEKGEFNLHKTVKPLALCKHLISLSCREGATVLDPFAGSGTTLVAAAQLNRKYIGIEINEEYVNIINKRLESK